jgi:hypothetical protein
MPIYKPKARASAVGWLMARAQGDMDLDEPRGQRSYMTGARGMLCCLSICHLAPQTQTSASHSLLLLPCFLFLKTAILWRPICHIQAVFKCNIGAHLSVAETRFASLALPRGGVKTNKNDVSKKAFFLRLRKNFRDLFFYRVFELFLLRNAQKTR